MYTVQAPTWGTTRQLKQVAKLILYQLLTTIAIQFYTQFSPRIGFHLTPAGEDLFFVKSRKKPFDSVLKCLKINLVAEFEQFKDIIEYFHMK